MGRGKPRPRSRNWCPRDILARAGTVKTAELTDQLRGITAEETQWCQGRRGNRLRPFRAQAGVEPRGTSRRLQRPLADRGAEEGFARAAARGREHRGVAVATGRLRRPGFE